MPKTERYTRRVELPVSAAETFAWHERPGALERLVPPWERVKVEQPSRGIQVGERVVLINYMGLLPLRWVAEHQDYQPGVQFQDTQLSGPFAEWRHTHRFEPDGADACQLIDDIEYRVPGGAVGRLLGGRFVRSKIDRMFRYRHAVTFNDLRAHAAHAGTERLRIAVTGASGLIGQSLVAFLSTGGHDVVRLVRRAPVPDDEVQWSPAGEWDAAALGAIDAVVHLAGASVASGRWTDRVKAAIRTSRIDGTKSLVAGLNTLPVPPRTFISASAIGYYGDRGDEALVESSPAGQGFLADVVSDWESCAAPLADRGVRVASLRFGMVLTPRGGALANMLPPFRWGVGGPVGGGSQWWSWISIDDAIGALHHVLMNSDLAGPVNATAPEPLTSRQFGRALGAALRRPALLPLPAAAARLRFGQMADELLLASARVHPQKLIQSGFVFQHAELPAALSHLLGVATIDS